MQNKGNMNINALVQISEDIFNKKSCSMNLEPIDGELHRSWVILIFQERENVGPLVMTERVTGLLSGPTSINTAW
jgi:hypothetical protein